LSGIGESVIEGDHYRRWEGTWP